MRKLLLPLGNIYNFLSWVRRDLYKNNLIKSESLVAPVISVGNLTVGGTGKTPFVDLLLSHLENMGLKICVLTRGYKRNSKSTVIVNGETLPSQGGDEPVWLSRRHQKSIIAVGSNRLLAAKKVIESFKPDVYILDDGFQHLKIKRNLDIVLIDCTRPLWHYDVVPAGYGRESFSSLKRAQIVILNRVNQVKIEEVDKLEARIRNLGVKEVVRSEVRVKATKEIRSQKNYDLKNKKVYLLSGIANPKSFENLLREWGANVIFHREKSDHFNYTQEEFSKILKEAKDKGSDALVTTEKDAIKLENLKFDDLLPIVQVEMELKLIPGLPSLKKWIGL